MDKYSKIQNSYLSNNYLINSRNRYHFQNKLSKWFLQQKSHYPWRVEKGCIRNPYYVWVSEIMLQQTNITTVLPKFEIFINKFPSIYDLAKVDEEGLRPYVQGLGYYNRFKNLIKTSKILTLKYPILNSYKNWPKEYEEWISFPGIGDYTSSAITSIAFLKPYAVLDGNVERVICRIFDFRFPANDKKLKPVLKFIANSLLNTKDSKTHNESIMELGQKICKKSNPLCDHCELSRYCLSFKNKSQSLAPGAKIKDKTELINLEIAIPIYKDKIGITQRSDQSKFLKKSFGFPLSLLKKSEVLPHKKGSTLLSEKNRNQIGSFNHRITKYNIIVTVVKKETKDKKGLTLYSKNELKQKLVASLDMKALDLYLKYQEPH